MFGDVRLIVRVFRIQKGVDRPDSGYLKRKLTREKISHRIAVAPQQRNQMVDHHTEIEIDSLERGGILELGKMPVRAEEISPRAPNPWRQIVNQNSLFLTGERQCKILFPEFGIMQTLTCV